MDVTYQLTQRDFYECLVAHRNRTAWLKWLVRAVVLFVFVLAVVGLLLTFFGPRKGQVTDALPLFGLAGMWALFIWGWPSWSARIQFRNQPAVQVPRTLNVDGTGVHLRWDGGLVDIEWKNVIRFLESKTHFMVYTSPACFDMVPKRVLTPAQLHEVRSLLKEHVGGR